MHFLSKVGHSEGFSYLVMKQLHSLVVTQLSQHVCYFSIQTGSWLSNSYSCKTFDKRVIICTVIPTHLQQAFFQTSAPIVAMPPESWLPVTAEQGGQPFLNIFLLLSGCADASPCWQWPCPTRNTATYTTYKHFPNINMHYLFLTFPVYRQAPNSHIVLYVFF